MKPFTKKQIIENNNNLKNGICNTADLSWAFEAQCWVKPEVASTIDGDCLNPRCFTSFYDWFQTALFQISESIAVCNYAVITDGYDEDFAILLRELGYSTLPCVDFVRGEEVEYTMVFSSVEDEEEFLEA